METKELINDLGKLKREFSELYTKALSVEYSNCSRAERQQIVERASKIKLMAGYIVTYFK